jgi:predicted RNA polymerase sigma factor
MLLTDARRTARDSRIGELIPLAEQDRAAWDAELVAEGLLRQLGRSTKARAAYESAIQLAGNTAETAYLTRRRDQLVG